MPSGKPKKTNRSNRSHLAQELSAKFQAGFLSTLDGRTDLAKALRANYDEIIADIGGKEETSHVKNALVECFVWLEAILQSIEHEMANGQISKTEAVSRWVQCVNSLVGLGKVLGIERKSTAKPWLTIPATTESPGELEDK